MLRTTLVSLTLASGLVLGGCAQAEETPDPAPTTAAGSASSSPSEPAATPADGLTVDITLEDGKYQPQGETVKVPRGEPVTLRITADEADELHVHSTPEAQIEVAVGQTSKTLTFDRPGVVDVESHHSGVVVVKLQVR